MEAQKYQEAWEGSLVGKGEVEAQGCQEAWEESLVGEGEVEVGQEQ